jgi:hypothetical protein
MNIIITITAHMEDYDIGTGLENQQAVIEGHVRQRFEGTALHINSVSMKEDLREEAPGEELKPARSTRPRTPTQKEKS